MMIGLRSGHTPLTLVSLLLATLSMINGCASQAPAPVIERSTPVAVPAASATPVETHAAAEPKTGAIATAGTGLYTVKRGDTLYSIALENGQSYRDLAAWNNLDDPNKIQVGQQLRVKPLSTDGTALVAIAKPVALASPIESRPLGASTTPNTEVMKREPRGGKLPYSDEALARLQKAESIIPADSRPEVRPTSVEKPIDRPTQPIAAEDPMDWAWPATGKLIANFVDGASKGLDIAGTMGESVLAAASGKVILVSSALRGYGNFVIIKHNASYLSVYAHNSRVLVKEEQQVSKGQKIAEIGSSDSDRPKLHFEIRHQGKPVDPIKFLPPR